MKCCHLMHRLNEVLEVAEDYSIDIPKIWDYLGEALAPVMAHSTLCLSLLDYVPSPLVSHTPTTWWDL